MQLRHFILIIKPDAAHLQHSTPGEKQQ